jgi:rhodanese-related sulfurtransferase
MSHFPTKLELEYIDGKNWLIKEPFVFEVGKSDLQLIITVPIGAETDGASIPKVFRGILSPFDEQTDGAVVHDYLYRSGKSSRFLADALFYEGMRAQGVKAWKATVMWLAVRLFGRFAYKGEYKW